MVLGGLAPWLLVVLLAAAACGDKRSAIATLEKAEGPVDRQVGTGPWNGAKLGAKFYLGDAARTADGGAQLEVAGNAKIAMQPRTILRFGGTASAGQLSVEVGAIDLTGTGSYGFDLGDVRLSRNGTVRITANPNGKPKIELTIGEAQVSTLTGETIDLVVGSAIELDIGSVKVTAIDAGVDAPPPVDAAAPDAPDPVATTEGATLEATGKRVEILLPGEKKWAVVQPGQSTVPEGAKLRVGDRSSAKVTAHGTALEMGGGSRLAIGENLELVIELGELRASSAGDGKVQLPGGSLALLGAANGTSEAKLGVGQRGDAKVTMTRGTAKLTGAPGSELALNRGESATLAKAGTIRVLEAIPTYFDFRVSVGETITIHDPRPPTAVQFTFAGKCAGGGIIEMDRDNRYRTAKVSAGKEAANHSVGAGGWAYRLRCTTGGGEGTPVGSGRIVVVRDDGRRKLPKAPPVNTIDADGRTWAVWYQSEIPTIQFVAKTTGKAFKLHLAREGKEEVFEAKKPLVTVQGSKLKEGDYTYWFDIDGVAQAKKSLLKIDFDQTTPQVYIEAPLDRRPWEGDIDVRGAVLEGWTAAVDGITIPIDRQRRFAAKVQKPTGNALAIRLSHPQRGTHYYLRRSK